MTFFLQIASGRTIGGRTGRRCQQRVAGFEKVWHLQKIKTASKFVYTVQYNEVQNHKWVLTLVSETEELFQPGQHRLIEQQSSASAEASMFSQIKNKISWLKFS